MILVIVVVKGNSNTVAGVSMLFLPMQIQVLNVSRPSRKQKRILRNIGDYQDDNSKTYGCGYRWKP
jgi:hypothetical protein